LQPLERLGESTDLRLLNDVVDLICEKKDLTAVIYDICNYQESDSACVYGKIAQVRKNTNFDAGLYDITGFLWALIISMYLYC
jgi:hypothetical protein